MTEADCSNKKDIGDYCIPLISPFSPSQLALYVCTKDKARDALHHYALNVPLYTHFTSPIRWVSRESH